MIRALCALVAAGILATATLAQAEPMPAPAYPDSRRDNVVEAHFGERIADPYRWLEGDVRSDPEVADWVERQNRVTRAYLDRLPQREWFEKRLHGLLSYERYGLPVKAGGRYFYEHNSGLQNQAPLYVRRGLRGKPRLLIDPNSWSGDQATALDAWKPSDDGKFLLYSVQDGGSDWRILKVIDVASGTVLADEVRWAKFTRLAWVGSEGFLYSRFPRPEGGQDFHQSNFNHSVWFHRLGTAQEVDLLIYATPDHPDRNHSAEVTSDGRMAVITSSVGTDARHELHVVDLSRRRGRTGERSWQVRQLVSGFDHDWKLVDGMGKSLWFVTNKDAPR
ncbi:MAG: S9 family peptidase, partial [Rhizobiaceae bacterium]